MANQSIRTLPTAKDFPDEFAPSIRRKLRWYIGAVSQGSTIVQQVASGDWQVFSKQWGMLPLRLWAYRCLYEFGQVWAEGMAR